jgi:hypothetical protein
MASSVANARAEEQKFLTNQTIALEATADKEAGVVDEMAGIVAGLAVFGIAMAGIATAGITGGASLAVAGVAAAAALGVQSAVEETVEDDVGKSTVGYLDAKTDLE